MCIHARTNTSIFQKHYNCIYLPHFSIPYVRKAPKIYPQKEVLKNQHIGTVSQKPIQPIDLINFQFLIKRTYQYVF